MRIRPTGDKILVVADRENGQVIAALPVCGVLTGQGMGEEPESKTTFEQLIAVYPYLCFGGWQQAFQCLSVFPKCSVDAADLFAPGLGASFLVVVGIAAVVVAIFFVGPPFQGRAAGQTIPVLIVYHRTQGVSKILVPPLVFHVSTHIYTGELTLGIRLSSINGDIFALSVGGDVAAGLK